ncbi:hypothetical protein F5Y15DRAFT_381095 [Xylariaceae sp. FL0016]|nr:hypothetical protein F5Y15DRAFT_381095 [Xylariaceae sp. FL0016]
MEAVRFSVPISLRTFDLFAQLPYDIRYLIWMEAILTPGIHFLKLVELNDRADHPPSSSDRDDGSNHEELTELASPYTAQLQAVFPFAAADRSYYMTMNKKLILVALTCREANRLVSRIVSRPGNLTLDSGRLVLLDKSWDIVSIEYPDMFSNIGNGITKLGDWADSLNTDQLDKVRRLALRYSVLWNRDSVCPSCGLIHQGARRRTLPRHIYRFAALFRNLETFYFIDCLAHRKPQRSVACGGGGQEG